MTAKLIVNSEIIKAPQGPADACWRCGGSGVVAMQANTWVGAAEGETTVCGACMGVAPPKPCPKCGSKRVKIATDGYVNYWRCRDCGYNGPANVRDWDAYHAWQKHIPGKGAT
jgi:hypothetical protein